MNTVKAVCLLTAAICLSACATVVRGTNNDVTFTSTPSGAQVTTTLGHQCITPCQVRVGRRDEFVATFTHDGRRREIPVNTRVAGTGAGAMAGNLLLGGIVGGGVDLATGAALEHYPNPVHADFSALPRRKAVTITDPNS